MNNDTRSFEDVYRVQTATIERLEAENARLREVISRIKKIITRRYELEGERAALSVLCEAFSTPSTQAENVSKNSGEIEG